MTRLPQHLIDKLPPDLPPTLAKYQLRRAVKRARDETLKAMTQRDMAKRQLEATRSAVNQAAAYQRMLDDILYELEHPDETDGASKLLGQPQHTCAGSC